MYIGIVLYHEKLISKALRCDTC